MSWQGVVISKPCLHLCSMACLLVNLCFIFKHFSLCFPTPYRLSCLLYERVRVTSIISTIINVTANEPLVLMVRWLGLLEPKILVFMVRGLLKSKILRSLNWHLLWWMSANRQTTPVVEFSESCPPYYHSVFTVTIPCYLANLPFPDQTNIAHHSNWQYTGRFFHI